MPKFGMTDKRPRAWSRRAKTDGSCNPPLKRPKVRPNSSFLHWAKFFLNVTFALWMASLLFLVARIFVIKSRLESKPAASPSLQPILDAAHVSQWLGGVMILAVLVNTFSHLATAHWFRKRVVQTRLQICPRCGYDISNRVNDEPCPECGQEISRRELIRIWCKALH